LYLVDVVMFFLRADMSLNFVVLMIKLLMSTRLCPW